jgi:hypothetical protein
MFSTQALAARTPQRFFCRFAATTLAVENWQTGHFMALQLPENFLLSARF